MNLYTERERQIYRYWDGQKTVCVDPAEIYSRIMSRGPELNADMQLACSKVAPAAWAAKGQSAMIGKIRDFFNIKSLAEGGLTETEIQELFGHFFAFCDNIRKQFEIVSDLSDGNITAYILGYCNWFRRMFMPKPTYLESFGFWLNRRRVLNRRASCVALGAGIAMNLVDPGMGYYRDITDGEGEAIALKGMYDAARKGTEQHG